MGYRGHDDWRDMSDYVVHFTKENEGASAYECMLAILATRLIKARTAFGAATNVAGLGDSQMCACFSEIPLDMLDRLVARRSTYGIGFHQNVVVGEGGGRVWYLDPGTPQTDAFYANVTEAMSGGVEPSDSVWRLTPFIDYTAPNYQFVWEREWRLPGGLEFSSDDVAFLFVPEEHHEAAKPFLATGNHGNGPAYACPILDPLWDDDQIQKALAELAPGPS